MDIEKAKRTLDICLEPIKSHEENQQMFTEWSKTYDTDHELLQLRSPMVLGQTVADLFPVNRENVCILDIAAGTGLAGVELRAHGFKIIDALEENESMLECARNKYVHCKEFVEAVPEEGSTSIASNSYDVVTCRGGFGPGGLPVNAVIEMIRLAKPDGYIIIAIGEQNFEDVAEYKNSLRPQMLAFEKSGQWTKVKEEYLERAMISSAGFVKNVLFVYKKNSYQNLADNKYSFGTQFLNFQRLCTIL